MNDTLEKSIKSQLRYNTIAEQKYSRYLAHPPTEFINVRQPICTKIRYFE